MRYGSVGVGAYAHSVNFEAESRKRNNSLDAGAWMDAGPRSCFDMIFDVGLTLLWHCKPGDRLDPSYMRIVAASAIRLHEASVISTAAFAAVVARISSNILCACMIACILLCTPVQVMEGSKDVIAIQLAHKVAATII